MATKHSRCGSVRTPTCLRLLLSGLCLGAVSLSLGAQTLLVVNQGDSDLGFIDPVSGVQVATMADETPGVHGHEIAVSADGRTAYMQIYGSAGVGKPGINGHEMLIIDVLSRKIVRDFDFGHEVRPHLPVMDYSRNLLYVTTELDKTVTAIDLKSLKIVGMIPTGQEQSHMLVLSHDGRRGYTANVGPGTVSVLDMIGRKTIAIIPISATVQRISISNDDKLVFTSDQIKPQLIAIDTAANKVKTTVPLPGFGYGTAPTSDGHWLLVAVPPTHQVAVIDLSTMQVAHLIDVPGKPQEILIRPDDKIASASLGSSAKVAAIDLNEWTVTKVIDAGRFADGLAWAK